MVGLDKLASYSNYFLGRDSGRWKSRVGHYQRVLSQEVWPGVDVEYILKPGGVELVYHLQAGADPAQIQIQIEGLSAPLTLDATGNLMLPTSLGPLVEQAPTALQSGRAIACRYRLTSDSTYSFSLDGYVPQQELVIDPLLYSTFLGPTWDGIDEFQIDPRDQTLVVAGSTFFQNFPTTPGAYQDSLMGLGNHTDLFITRFAPDGRTLRFSTYLGGMDEEDLAALHITPDGEICVGGYTLSNDWPLTNAAVDTVFAISFDGYFCRLSADGGDLQYSTFWGHYVEELNSYDNGWLYICGRAATPDFYTTPDALFPEFPGFEQAFITVFDPVLSQILYSTYFSGAGTIGFGQIVVLEPMRVWITGSTSSGGIPITANALQPEMEYTHPSFLARLDLGEGLVEYCSYFGGSLETIVTTLLPLTDDRLLLSGWTRSPNFPVTPGAYDTTHSITRKAFVTDLTLPATVERSTLFGLGQYTGFIGVPSRAAILPADSSIILCGSAQGPGFPATPDALDSVTGPEWPDAYFAVLSPDLSTLRYSTLLGGYEKDDFRAVQIAQDNTIWFAGMSECVNFPVTPDAFQHQQLGWGDGVLCQFSLPWIDAAADPLILHPSSFILSAYPNPFNSTTEIRYALPRAGHVLLKVYDVLGREVGVLIDAVRAAGEQRAAFDARGLASGIYFVRLDGGGMRVTRKVLLVR